MAKPNRTPLQVSPEFKKRIDELQRKIMMAKGQKRSLRDITEDIVTSPLFSDIERNLIRSGNMNIDLKVKFDRRIFE